jgi:phosphatidylserine/phosphatidylglycerophosphate/cardiolipin synthase-like enzyme
MTILRILATASIAALLSGCEQKDPSFSRAYFSRPKPVSASSSSTLPRVGLEQFIDEAEHELLFCMFRFNLENIADALIRAQERGVAIRVFTDQDCLLARRPSAYGRLVKAGISVKCDTAVLNSVMHHKFIVVDNRAVWTGDWNTHTSDSHKAHHSAFRVRSPELAKLYTRLFNHLASGSNRDGLRNYPSLRERSCVAANGIEFALHHAPEVRGSEAIARALADANSDIVVAHCYLGDRWVIKELLHAARRGVRVRGVYNSAEGGYERSLALQGADLRKAAPTFLGSKYFVVDGKHLLTGSWNCSGSHRDAVLQRGVGVEDHCSILAQKPPAAPECSGPLRSRGQRRQCEAVPTRSKYRECRAEARDPARDRSW